MNKGLQNDPTFVKEDLPKHGNKKDLIDFKKLNEMLLVEANIVIVPATSASPLNSCIMYTSRGIMLRQIQ